MYNPTYRLKAIEEAKKLKEELDYQKSGKELYQNNPTFLQFAESIINKSSNLKIDRLKEFYDQIIKDDGELLPIDNNTKEIYVKLLNFRVPQKGLDRLKEIRGSVQPIRGNNDKQSKNVNMDYFSVRIDKMPTFGYEIADAGVLFKKIRDNFLTLSKGSKVFESKCAPYPKIKGYWEFKPYPKNSKDELNRWEKQLCNSIFLIEAKSGLIMGDNVYSSLIPKFDPADSGAVLESEISNNTWIFTTIFTPESDTQPFSGNRQFGIGKDENGNYRFFARAIDRIWPSNFISKTNGKECSVENYLTIADATWNNLIKNVSEFINKNGGRTTIIKTEPIRIDFDIFFSKFRSEKPVNFVGNIEQFKTV